jgi:hypothetical protein
MSEESTEVIDNQALGAGDPPPAADPPPAPEPAADPPPSPPMVSRDVLIREVTPLRAKNRELEQALDEHRRQIREQNELLLRLQRGEGDQPPPRQAQPEYQPTQADVLQAAAALNFQRDASRVSQSGIDAYGRSNWDDACRLMDTFGLNSTEFVGSVMEIAGSDKTHELFHAIAQDPEKAAQLKDMTPLRRVAEITRMAEKMTAKPAAAAAAEPTVPARTVSRAPAPPPRVDTAASKVLSWQTDQDKMSDEEWSRNWNERMSKRNARR